MEKYGEIPPRFTKKWWEHFWEYYRWRVIIALTALLIAVVTVVQCTHKTVYDLVMVYTGHSELSKKTQASLASLASELVGDADGNGEVNVDLKTLVFTDIDGNEDFDFALQTKLDLTFVDDYTYIYLMDETQARIYAGRKDTAKAFDEVSVFADGTDKEILYTDDGGVSYAVSLRGSTLLRENGINADTLYLLVRRSNLPGEKNTISHDSAIKFASEIVK